MKIKITKKDGSYKVAYSSKKGPVWGIVSPYLWHTIKRSVVMFIPSLRRCIVMILIISTGASFAKAQTIKHHDYTAHYNAAIKESDSVSWTLAPTMVACTDVTRKDAFKTDPMLPGSASPDDYALNSDDPKNPKYNPDRASWIDEGHLFSYQSAMCTPYGVYECFYMTNMLPQFHAFNAGDWKTLEVQERVWAKTTTLYEVAGGYGTCKLSKKFPTGKLPNGENIPAYMWKAIYMNHQWQVWIMPNWVTSVGHPYTKWLDPQLHSFDLKAIAAEIARLKI